jgi:hypothetical protein
MLVGVHEDKAPVDTKDTYPRGKVFREFIPGVLKPQSLIEKVQRLGTPVWAIGGILAVSFKPDLKSVMSGDWDTHLQGLAGWLRTVGGPTYLIPWHEPENDMTAAQFVSMFNHVYVVMKDEFPQLTLMHAAMAYQYRPNGKASNAAQWLTKADVNTCDVYRGKSSPLGQILPEHAGFKQWHAVFGKRSWGITESGFHATPTSLDECKLRAATIRREADWLATQPSCIMYIYWNTSGTENNPELVLDAKGKEAVLYLTELLGGGSPVSPTHEITCPACKGTGKITVDIEDDR